MERTKTRTTLTERTVGLCMAFLGAIISGVRWIEMYLYGTAHTDESVPFLALQIPQDENIRI